MAASVVDHSTAGGGGSYRDFCGVAQQRYFFAMRSSFLPLATLIVALRTVLGAVPLSGIDVAAFVYDPWTPEPTVFGAHGNNWTEWELVRKATPRFPGHTQPHVPLWGEIDTGLPETWSFLNEQALSHGISVSFAQHAPNRARQRFSPAKTLPSRCTCGIFTGGATRPKTLCWSTDCTPSCGPTTLMRCSGR